MTVITAPSAENTGRLRPLNVLHDLPAVADLIETCFAATLDSEGRSFLDQMRRTARDSRQNSWAPRILDPISVPLSGFVWEDDGRIVGNVSLIPFFKWGQRHYLLANIATHPQFRRQGIARQLTETAMRRAREKHADALWLHVRDDNPGAIKLYEELGFQERARRTQWQSHPSRDALSYTPPGIVVTDRPIRDWDAQRRWLDETYPEVLSWYFQQSWDIFKPGLVGGFFRIFAEDSISQWSVYRARQLRGVLALQHSGNNIAHLWAAFPQNPDPDALTTVLLHARSRLASARSITLDVPASLDNQAINAAGFLSNRTLLWMEARGATS